MFYYFQDKHKLSEGKLELKEHKNMFSSHEMELYSVHKPAIPLKWEVKKNDLSYRRNVWRAQ